MNLPIGVRHAAGYEFPSSRTKWVHGRSIEEESSEFGSVGGT